MIGKVTLAQRTGRPLRVSADGYPEYCVIGVTVAWSTRTAANSTSTLDDGTKIFAGEKYFRFGSILVPVRRGVRYTAAITGSPTGGNFTLSVTRGADTQTTANIAYNATAAAVKSALEGLSNVGTGKVWVSLATSTYTITFDSELGAVTLAKDATGLTGGTTPNITLTAVFAAVSDDAGKFGLYDNTATDGRQFLERDRFIILDYTIKDQEATVMGANLDNEHVGGIVGGIVYKQRLLVRDNTATATDPTLAELLAVAPRLSALYATA